MKTLLVMVGLALLCGCSTTKDPTAKQRYTLTYTASGVGDSICTRGKPTVTPDGRGEYGIDYEIDYGGYNEIHVAHATDVVHQRRCMSGAK